jgi:hypothetical protein
MKARRTLLRHGRSSSTPDYTSPLLEDAPSECVMDLDRKLSEQLLLADALTVIAIDVADQSVQSGVNVGFLDQGVAENEASNHRLGWSTSCPESISPPPLGASALSGTEPFAGSSLFARPGLAAFACRSFPQRRVVKEADKEWVLSKVKGRSRWIPPCGIQRLPPSEPLPGSPDHEARGTSTHRSGA